MDSVAEAHAPLSAAGQDPELARWGTESRGALLRNDPARCRGWQPSLRSLDAIHLASAQSVAAVAAVNMQPGGIWRWANRPDDREVTATRETGRRLIASNRRARHDYTILKTYEAGIVLIGNEVKSLRAGYASLLDAFVQESDGELMLHGLHIPEHVYGRRGTRALYQPRRTRKLLLHRSEIDKIIGRLGDAGVTVVPLSLYFQDGWAKVEVALARGRRSFDKRQAIAQRDAGREIARELSDRLRGRRRRPRGSS